MAYNSTIITRKKKLKCGCYDYNFSNGLCKTHATIVSTHKRMAKENDKANDEGLSDLIEQADRIFSQYVRLSAADKEGNVKCFICDHEYRWQDAQCMHYIPRANMYTRYSLENCKAGCQNCNEYKAGNLIKYGERLDAINPGATELLYEQGHIIYKYSRDELKQTINEFSLKLKQLKSKQ